MVIVLGVAEITIGILEYFNKNYAPKIGVDVINVAQLVFHVNEAFKEKEHGPIPEFRIAAITAEIGGLLASAATIAYSKTRFLPLAGAYAIFKTLEIVATYASTALPDAHRLKAELEQRQREIIGTFDTQVSERTAEVTAAFDSQLASYAATLGL